jgi:ribosome-associated translation inhibitor RaiA
MNSAIEEYDVNSECASHDGIEISARFRQTIEERIARLEKDAASDEMLVAHLENGDHIRRHMRLVALQRTEALRMRSFLNRAKVRAARPFLR